MSHGTPGCPPHLSRLLAATAKIFASKTSTGTYKAAEGKTRGVLQWLSGQRISSSLCAITSRWFIASPGISSTMFPWQKKLHRMSSCNCMKTGSRLTPLHTSSHGCGAQHRIAALINCAGEACGTRSNSMSYQIRRKIGNRPTHSSTRGSNGWLLRSRRNPE